MGDRRDHCRTTDDNVRRRLLGQSPGQLPDIGEQGHRSAIRLRYRGHDSPARHSEPVIAASDRDDGHVLGSQTAGDSLRIARFIGRSPGRIAEPWSGRPRWWKAGLASGRRICVGVLLVARVFGQASRSLPAPRKRTFWAEWYAPSRPRHGR